MTEPATTCHGNWASHCCWLAGKVCPFLEVETVPGRRWACGLRRALGSWEAVHSDRRYINVVRPVWDVAGPPGVVFPDCGRWPQDTAQPARCCWNTAEPLPVTETEDVAADLVEFYLANRGIEVV